MSTTSSSVGKNRLVDDTKISDVDKSVDLRNSIGEDVVIQ
jgi:hypothetical protein